MNFTEVIVCIHAVFGIALKDAAIVGGAARDKFYGLRPKDIDYAVVLSPDFQDDVEVFRLLSELSEELSFVGVNSEVFQAYGKEEGREIAPGTFSDRIFGVMRIYADDTVVELLVTKRNSLEEMISEFDTSMNQFMMRVNPLDGSALPQYVGKPEEHIKLVGLKFKTDCHLAINDDRRERMRIKYNKIKEQSSRLYGEILP